jgi:hypothetical protein
MNAAVQPGNSGGPAVDDAGLLLGVAVGRLNDLAVLRATGSLPQGVNFAIRATEVRTLPGRAECPPGARRVRRHRRAGGLRHRGAGGLPGALPRLRPAARPTSRRAATDPPQPFPHSAVLSCDCDGTAARCGAGEVQSEAETERRMAELERILNDPETRMDANRVWTLLAELARPGQPARG